MTPHGSGNEDTVELPSPPFRSAVETRPGEDSTLHGGPDRMAELAAASRARLPDPPEELRLGRLEFITHIGSGGMGDVYVAHDRELDRRVAVKIVRADLDHARYDASARIVREAQMMARITHPNVVRVYDVGRLDSRVYITMEYVEGTTLRGWLDRGKRTWREILELFLRAGRGLSAAHRTGLVHRDFKPANVLVGDDDRVLVADFGLARPLGGELDSTSSGSRSPSPSLSPALVTAHGTILGTPGYMAPEQLRAGPVDARSDLFSFCVALFEALHGARPYAGRSAETLLATIEAGTISPPIARRRVPAWLDRALVRGLSADPARRHPTMAALLAELEQNLRRPGRILGVSLVAAGLVAGVAVAGLGPFADDPPCAAAGTELSAVWNPGQRDLLHARFAATGLDFADAAAQRTAAGLDAYAAAWQAARVDACAATAVRRDQSAQLFDQRIACLDRRRRAVTALVDTLTTADPTTVEQSVDALASLPAIDPCNDPTWLARSVRPPDTTPQVVAVARARARIARGDALAATGHYREGLAQAALAVTATNGVDYEPVRAEALALRGRLLVHLGDLGDAESTLLTAAELAEANHHDDLGADIWLDLVRLATRHLHDPARGAAWISRARAAQRRIGDPAPRRVLVLTEEALVHAHAHDHDAALRTLRAALTLHAEVGGDMRTLAKLYQLHANSLEATGKHAEARADHQRALAASESAFGPDHPEYAAALHDFSIFLTVLGELDEAEPRLQRALDIYTRTFGETHQLVGRVHIALVELALRRDAFPRAIAHAETAARIHREVLPDDHPARIDAELALGTARFFGGHLAPALDAFLAARELQRRVPTPDPLVLAVTACDVAETLVALDRRDEAHVFFSEVEQLLAAAPTHDRDLEARVLTGRGKLALGDGDAPRALPLLEAALELRRQLPADPLALAELSEALDRARRG